MNNEYMDGSYEESWKLCYEWQVGSVLKSLFQSASIENWSKLWHGINLNPSKYQFLLFVYQLHRTHIQRYELHLLENMRHWE